MKKIFYFVILAVVGIFVLFIVDYRTPLFQLQGGNWSIAYGSSFKNIKNLNLLENKTIFSFEKLKEVDSKTLFLADPFFVKEKDSFYIFFEHQKTNSNGKIGLMTSSNGIDYNYKGTVLEEKFHLSYPHVFKYKNQYYMLPETKRAGAVLLYKSTCFPSKWEICDTLVKDVKLKDPTIYLSDSLNVFVASDDDLNLHMFMSDSLNGRWEAYKKAIIKKGTEARPGGRFIVNKKGQLLLPLQNSTHGYGYGISLYRFNFERENLTLEREFPFFIKRTDSLKLFNFGMHHVDMQFIGDSIYYVFDGNTKKGDDKVFNIRGPLKWNFIDLIDAIQN